MSKIKIWAYGSGIYTLEGIHCLKHRKADSPTMLRNVEWPVLAVATCQRLCNSESCWEVMRKVIEDSALAKCVVLT